MGCSEFDFQTGTCSNVIIGKDYINILTFTDEAGAINLTGFDLTGQIKDTLSGSVLLSLSIVANDQTTGFYIPDPTNGIINFIIKKETVIASGVYPYEFVLINPSTDENIFMQGTIQFYTRGF